VREPAEKSGGKVMGGEVEDSRISEQADPGKIKQYGKNPQPQPASRGASGSRTHTFLNPAIL